MAKRHSAHNEQAWRNAKKLCSLNNRQISMARALGMNPKKLPGLRPSPQQRWKLPVGAFIEECYRKRFGRAQQSHDSPQSKSKSWLETADARETPIRQVESLVCYLANLFEDLEQWLVKGTIPPEVLAQLREEFRQIANALESGQAIPELPGISTPSEPSSSLSEHISDDDLDIPF